jgi:hypothetical protein
MNPLTAGSSSASRVGLMAISMIVVGCASGGASRQQASEVENEHRKTQQQVQSELMGFADRLTSLTFQAAGDFEAQLQTPEARQDAAREQVAALLAATDIAAGPNPGGALLDMTVFVTLKRMAWEEVWGPRVYGEAAQVMVDTYRQLEDDIWAITAGVYSPEQVEQLHQVIADWRAQNPDVTVVGMVRLAEFGDSRQISGLQNAGKPGGMLAPVREANRNIEEMRLVAERVMFMITRMQLMLNLQTHWAFTDIAMQPEVRQLLANSQGFLDVADSFAVTFDELVEGLPVEREAAIEQALTGLNEEWKEILFTLTAGEGGVAETLGEVHATVEAASELAERLNQVIVTADAFLRRIDEEGSVDTKPFDILEYQGTLVDATMTLKEINAALASVERLLESTGLEKQLPLVVEGANTFEEEVVSKILNRLFLQGVLLIFVYFGVFIAYRWAVRRVSEPRAKS